MTGYAAVQCFVLSMIATAATGQTPPQLKRCTPHVPVGVISGTGTVSFRITAAGRVDSATIRVVQADGISVAGVLSAAQRFFPGCRYTPARQLGHPVPVTVEQPLHFPLATRPLQWMPSEDDGPIEELPAVVSCQAGSVVGTGSLTLAFVIGPDGRADPTSVETAGPLQHPVRLDVLQRIAGMCRFAPARREGLPVPYRVRQRFVFEAP